jgi:N-acetylneuraminate synthase
LYPYPVGFSDHTIGTAIPLAAAAKGACVIEKHFTFDKNMPGWDHKVSANFEEMKQIVMDAKRIKAALGSFQRVLSDAEWDNRNLFRRSIVARREIPAGKTMEYDDFDTKRPGTGLEPKYLDLLVGKKAQRTILYDELIRKDDY